MRYDNLKRSCRCGGNVIKAGGRDQPSSVSSGTHQFTEHSVLSLSSQNNSITMGKGRKNLPHKLPQQSVDPFSSSEGEDEEHEEEPPVPADASPEVSPDVMQRRLSLEDSERNELDVLDEAQTPIDQDATQMDPPSQATCSGGSSGKRKRTYHIIPEAKEESVVEWFREHEFLYNKKLRAYRDRERKTRAWEAKAKELNVEGEYRNVYLCLLSYFYNLLCIQTMSRCATGVRVVY